MGMYGRRRPRERELTIGALGVIKEIEWPRIITLVGWGRDKNCGSSPAVDIKYVVNVT
jgi:hypothetical protein